MEHAWNDILRALGIVFIILCAMLVFYLGYQYGIQRMHNEHVEIYRQLLHIQNMLHTLGCA